MFLMFLYPFYILQTIINDLLRMLKTVIKFSGRAFNTSTINCNNIILKIRNLSSALIQCLKFYARINMAYAWWGYPLPSKILSSLTLTGTKSDPWGKPGEQQMTNERPAKKLPNTGPGWLDNWPAAKSQKSTAS